MMKRKSFKIAFVLAFIYVTIGSIELFTDMNIAKYMDNLIDGLDLFTIFPAHILGSMFWWTLGNSSKVYIVYAWIGQFISLIIFTFFFYSIILIGMAIRKSIKF